MRTLKDVDIDWKDRKLIKELSEIGTESGSKVMYR